MIMATSFARSGAAACIALSLIGVAYADPRTGTEEGIWKSAVPPHSMNGEFGNHDPIGLAAGAWIKALLLQQRDLRGIFPPVAEGQYP